jgi:hypothetical protein
MLDVLSRAFSARTLLILVLRAPPRAFLSHGFAAKNPAHFRPAKSDTSY